jgi:hypothetical protein
VRDSDLLLGDFGLGGRFAFELAKDFLLYWYIEEGA